MKKLAFLLNISMIYLIVDKIVHIQQRYPFPSDTPMEIALYSSLFMRILILWNSQIARNNRKKFARFAILT